jgi:hypothetical protein
MYVSDVRSPQRIISFGPTGRYRAATAADLGGGPLSFVNGLAAVDGTVLAADSNNARLVMFRADLSPVRSWRFTGLPRGLCAVPGSAGAAFAVVDTIGGSVRVVATDGSALANVGSQGSGRGELLQPTAVASDDDERIYVTDTGNARVSVWNVSATRSTNVFRDVLRDPRWWVAGALALAGAAVCAYIILSGRKRPSTI